ncbi:MAG TPA: hypothetical protein DCY97_10380 [Marinilabiliales bacterium]|nr:hypothetical protein [Marinilabiliales bacterium]
MEAKNLNFMHKIVLLGSFLLMIIIAVGQVPPDSVEQYLNQKAKDYTALTSRLEISVSEVSLDEFLRAIAVANKLNFDIADNLDDVVVNNFSGVMVKDMLAFICKQYNLTLEFTGNIISIRKSPTVKNRYTPKQSEMSFDTEKNTITFNFKNDSLVLVAEQITRLTQSNVVLAPTLSQKMVTCYIQDKPIENALDKLAFANNLKVTITSDGFFLLEPDEVETETADQMTVDRSSRNRTPSGRGGTNQGKEQTGFVDIKRGTQGKINLVAENFPLSELIKKVSEELKTNYFIVSKMEEPISLSLQEASFDQILTNIFAGTKYMFKKTDQYYVIGDRSSQEIKESRVIVLQNRTVEKLLDGLPKDILKDIDAKEFPEMNSILVNGSQTLLDNFEQFIQQVDQTVPVILIEVMIVYVSKNKGISTGISAGIGESAVTTRGTINPGMDLDVGASTLNNLINSFDGFGWLNLSEVHPNFYLQIKALEEAGFLDITSTPRLSTLNGHEAKMSTGNTEYYQEEQTQIIGTQNPQTNTTTTYKSVKADLSVTILPIVSGKENITMQVAVKQSDFTEKISKYAPPNTVDRSFESLIRIKNGEMILLGGLEEAEKEESSSGWPILSRLPILKWIFSSRSKSDSKSKLTVFIKPTIIP